MYQSQASTTRALLAYWPAYKKPNT